MPELTDRECTLTPGHNQPPEKKRLLAYASPILHVLELESIETGSQVMRENDGGAGALRDS